MGDLAASSGARAPDLSGARTPDFFIVGHSKCGTTALTRMVAAHPEIHIPVKEPGYFAPELRSRFRRARSKRRTDSLEGYLSLFGSALPGQRVGEGTPSYLRSPSAAARIAELRPDARIIAIFREPVGFCARCICSSCTTTPRPRRTSAGRSSSSRSGARASACRGSRRCPRRCSTRMRSATRSSCAASTRRSPPEQVLVLIYDDLRADNEATVREVWRFLDVDDSYPVQAVELAPLRPLRAQRLFQLWRVSRAARSDVPALGRLVRGAGRSKHDESSNRA